LPLDPGTGAPQTDYPVQHAPNAWNTMLRALARDLPNGLERAQRARERIRRLR
jgi:hypothetical protein